MKRQALLSVGLLVTGIAVSMVGCGDDGSSGNPDNAAGDAGKNAGAGTTNNGGKGGTESNGGNSAAGKGGFGGSGGVPVPVGGEGGVTQGGAGGTPDGPGDAGAGGAVGGAGGSGLSCPLNSRYGNLGALDGVAFEFDQNPGGIGWRGKINAPPPYEGYLVVELFDGYAPFEDGITTVTNRVLAGDDLQYATCGLCVRLFAVGEDATQEPYFVTGGSISVTSVEGSITGSAANLTFEEVTIDKKTAESTPVPNGCESSVSKVSFNDAFPQGGAGGSG